MMIVDISHSDYSDDTVIVLEVLISDTVPDTVEIIQRFYIIIFLIVCWLALWFWSAGAIAGNTELQPTPEILTKISIYNIKTSK